MTPDLWPAGGRAGAVAALMPVIARVVELEAGPPALVAWVRQARSAARPQDGRLVRYLAERLADRLAVGRRGETLGEQACQTVRVGRPGL